MSAPFFFIIQRGDRRNSVYITALMRNLFGGPSAAINPDSITIDLYKDYGPGYGAPQRVFGPNQVIASGYTGSITGPFNTDPFGSMDYLVELTDDIFPTNFLRYYYVVYGENVSFQSATDSNPNVIVSTLTSFGGVTVFPLPLVIPTGTLPASGPFVFTIRADGLTDDAYHIFFPLDPAPPVPWPMLPTEDNAVRFYQNIVTFPTGWSGDEIPCTIVQSVDAEGTLHLSATPIIPPVSGEIAYLFRCRNSMPESYVFAERPFNEIILGTGPGDDPKNPPVPLTFNVQAAPDVFIDIGGPPPQPIDDFHWEFTIAAIASTGPTYTRALALGRTRIRIDFDIAMDSGSGVNSSGAYTLLALNGGVVPNIISATLSLNAKFVILVLDASLTLGGHYTVTVDNSVTDTNSNTLLVPYTRDFWVPILRNDKVMSNGGYSISIEWPGVPMGEYNVDVIDNASTVHRQKSIDVDRGGRSVSKTAAINFVTVPMPVGGLYDIALTLGVGEEDLGQLSFEGVLQVVPVDLRSGIFAFRRSLMPKFKTGVRDIKHVKYPQED